tara:strand:+ start:1091 stop:1669 length:579 start_codon:yes stop_codon:yes gene_type:complete
MTTQKFKSLFENRFYNQSYKRWRIDKEKAGKDIVGEQYELFREEYYKGLGFEIGDGKKIFGSSYNCDTVVERNGEIVILEEDKASYVDSCFLGRAIQNAAEVFDICLEKKINIPYFVISSSTKYNLFDEICERRLKLFREDIQEVFKSKFVYLPLSENDRISQKKYFMTKESCFNLSDRLIEEQNKFIMGLL